ncbi:MAG: choice-of-anchor D domain-containing protein, partial [bacterium]
MNNLNFSETRNCSVTIPAGKLLPQQQTARLSFRLSVKTLMVLMLLVMVAGVERGLGQTTIFTESIGTVGSTTTIAAHETANGFDNDGYTMTSGGATNPADIRNTSVSSGYSGASGSANVYFTATNAAYGFAIEGIDASMYSSLNLQFGYRKESASVLPTLALDYWNGSAYVNISFTFIEAAGATAGWYLSPIINLPSGAQISTLKLRWVKTGTTAVRIDDIKLIGTPLAPEINIKQGVTNIATSGTFAYGNQTSGTSSSVTTFTVENTGTATLNLTGTPKIAISGTNASEFTVDQSSTTATVPAAGTTTFTITFSPTSQGAKTAAISIANDDATGSENPYVINLTGTGTVSAASDIVEKSGYAYPTNIAYGSYQSTDITGGSNDIEIAKFTIRDGGATTDADNLPTTLNQVVFTIGNFANIRRIALYDGATEVGTEQAGATSVTFSGLSLAAADGGTKDFSVRVSFKSSVTDNQKIQLTVAATTTAASAGSTFAATNAGGATSTLGANDNKIAVTATDLLFSQNPTTVPISSVMTPSPTIVAVDANANTDLDFAGPVTLTTTGTFGSGATTSVSSGSGTGTFTFSNLVFSAAGTGVTVNGSATGVNPTGNSVAFNVTNPLPEINIKQSATNIASAGSYGFGDQLSGTSSSAITFTIENIGSADLTLTGTPKIAIGGTNASEFTVDQSSTTATVAAAGTTTFTITFSPTTQGSKTAAISIANNDATGDENPYVINLTGTGTVSAASDIVEKSGYAYPTN